MKILDLPQAIKERRLFGLFDDFLWYISPHLWTSFNTGTGGASVAVGAAAFGGTAVLTTGATANNEAAIAPPNSPFSPGDDKPLLFEALGRYTQAATNKAKLFPCFSGSVRTP